MCKTVDIQSFKTNPSLRVSLATKLFQNGIDEQLIMTKTGHCSTDGVRKDKRIGNDQLQMENPFLIMPLFFNKDFLSDIGISAKIYHRISNTYERLQISRLHKISAFHLTFHSMCTRLHRVVDRSRTCAHI